jgi:hypothetical protein
MLVVVVGATVVVVGSTVVVVGATVVVTGSTVVVVGATVVVAGADVVVVVGIRSKIAVTARSWLMYTEQVEPEPVQAPLQPAKTDPASAAYCRDSLLLRVYTAEQVAPQLIFPLPLVTVPVPVPDLETDSVR